MGCEFVSGPIALNQRRTLDCVRCRASESNFFSGEPHSEQPGSPSLTPDHCVGRAEKHLDCRQVCSRSRGASPQSSFRSRRVWPR